MSRFVSWAVTHPGAVRRHNEDSFVDRPDLGLWAVADGAGGHDAGEVAAAMLKQALEGVPAGLAGGALMDEVRARVEGVHQALRAEAAERGPRSIIASTLVVLLVQGGEVACLWAGDARAYRLRDGVLSQMTRDHSLVQALVDAGAITEAEAERHPRANVITRAVGAEAALELEEVRQGLASGDRFLLCSDGLNKAVPEAELAALLAGPLPAERLVDAALARRASDNVTAVAIAVG
ncbi:MAG: protein phosphatase 2C domain-containing protein [Alphaproteobacteria bacterium]|nr:protein phosphatase 2C domain-containing protein [Alphaproteobacteria bacterium]